MIEGNVKYITGLDGHIDEVILPIATFKRMVDELEDKELLAMMKEIEANSSEYLSEDDSLKFLDSLIEESEVQD